MLNFKLKNDIIEYEIKIDSISEDSEQVCHIFSAKGDWNEYQGINKWRRKDNRGVPRPHKHKLQIGCWTQVGKEEPQGHSNKRWKPIWGKEIPCK